MILVLTCGRYDEYCIERIVEIPDAQAQQFIEETNRLDSESMRLSTEIGAVVTNVSDTKKRLELMRKPHKITETQNRLKKMETELAQLRQDSSANYTAQKELAHRIREAGKPVDDTVVQMLHLEGR